MIQSRKELRYYLKEDAKCSNLTNRYKYYAKLLYGSEDAHILRYLRTLRKYEYFHNCSKTLIGKMLCYYFRYRWMRYSLRYNLRIGINMVGYGFRIMHLFGGVIVNCESIGNYCRMNGGVIIGNKNELTAVAKIGTNVNFGAGCKIYGQIAIGDNVIIAPNAVVLKNVPNNCVVAGIPARIIKLEGEKVDINLT